MQDIFALCESKPIKCALGSLGSSENGVALANTDTHTKMWLYKLLILTYKETISKAHKHTHTIVDTLHPVALSNHRASMYPCVVVSVKSPCWAYGSPVNAKPSVCMCLDHILITAVGSVAQSRSQWSKATGQVRREAVIVQEEKHRGIAWKKREKTSRH